MLGAIAGDIIGSPYEGRRIKTTDFPLLSERSRFTDDSVLTVATAQVLLTGEPYALHFRRFAQAFPRAGYGGDFWAWSHQPGAPPYQSRGNGSAMRVSPIGCWAGSEAEALAEAERSSIVTHDHPEGIRGAKAVALAVFLAKSGATKDGIRERIQQTIGYPLRLSLDEIRPGYSFDVSCQGSVPEAITAFLEAESYEQAVRLAVSLGGDSDTQAAIAGDIAEAYWGPLPEALTTAIRAKLPWSFLEVIDAFEARFPLSADRIGGAL